MASKRRQLLFTWCLLLVSSWIASENALPISYEDGDVETPFMKSSRDQATFVPLARVASHPWQMSTAAHRNRTHSHHLRRMEENGDLFIRPKRRGGSLHFFARNDESSDEPEMSADTANDELTTTAPTEREEITEPKETPRQHRFKKNDALAEREKLMSKFWNSVYSPLPYGGPRALNKDDEAETGRAQQASSLPVARTAHREREKEKAELRVPTPDSEIPSPGHYRQPIDHAMLQSSKTRSGRRKQQNTEQIPSSTVNVEAFRILMEVIKSLREVSKLTMPTSPQPDTENLASISTEPPIEMDDA